MVRIVCDCCVGLFFSVQFKSIFLNFILLHFLTELYLWLAHPILCVVAKYLRSPVNLFLDRTVLVSTPNFTNCGQVYMFASAR